MNYHYVVTSLQNDEIICLWPDLDHDEVNGNPFSPTLKEAVGMPCNVYEADAPDGIKPNTHCYTSEAGFYANPNYAEPTPNALDQLTQEQIEALAQLTPEQLQALAGLSEGMLAEQNETEVTENA